ncbi:receptor expression-enhancing protein 3 [Pristis pectinata]|uniref:receptor expression-enhancing protein 3 n=1 Tax=Pristis pectinata TaxID=685728 RepID=UPI00223D7CF6|nr:receptor expression-enhancing protein 3 [Pristis pectinata]
MVSWIISRTVVLVFGTLYPAYYSYKAVKTKNVKEYVRWMMYWIVFALYTVLETFADLTIAWFPLYYELKVAFVIWLLSPYTRGAGVLYRKFLHPLLSSREREIDDYISQAKDRSYDTMVKFGKQGLNLAATAAVSAAVKSQGAITEKLRSLSMHDLTTIQGDEPVGHHSLTGGADTRKKVKHLPKEDFNKHFDYDDVDSEDRSEVEQNSAHSDDEVITQKHLQRSQSLKIKRKGQRKEVRYGSLKLRSKKRSQCSYIPG